MQAKWKLKRIGILSAMKIAGALSGVIGFVLGTVWGLMIIFFSSLMSMAMSSHVSGFGFSALIIFPILFTIFYSLLGAFIAFLFVVLYNLAAGIWGGIDLEVEYTYQFERKEENTSMYGML